ncbi:PEP-CTERM-box response regulator transcription factor [Geoalkalibacter subterraneus]|uniref:Fis family transcriptional regulator n=1 Tax=Geoalkalibacter subterraneus TaxID=483547 RepID=A0A0B5FPH4_9BACT|nr:PEP-CTERM-box response regulator transcription factor [Geoalkalibacter subterraneus]AJF06539.1 Fis family transcriptional regulator [Geoalkalibacter subterraneus]
MEKLLIVDDSEEIRKQLKWGLGRDYQVLLAGDGEEALSLFRKHRPRVMTLDLGLPPDPDGASEGLRCLEAILNEDNTAKVIMVTGNEERENALEAIQRGAYDFYSKPIDLGEVKVILKRAFHLAELEDENRRLHKKALGEVAPMGGLFGQCPQMQEVFGTIRKVASTDVPVFVLGESGTGKELVARAIHAHSLRKDATFVPINCGAIPDNLLEAELFGYEKGAFTGAQTRTQGKVEFAHKGTLFLDEIGELPTTLQVKLLRFLQEKTIQRVGGRENIEVDARIVAATNIDISDAIAQGAFREDLFYRIGVITLNLPPLRDRGEDIMLLAQMFLLRFADEFGRRVKSYSADAKKVLRRYNWPGNVREMENKIKRAVIMAEGAVIEAGDLGFETNGSPQTMTPELSLDGMTLKDAREKVERDMVLMALNREGGNIAKASEMLGVSRPTFYDLLRRHNLQGAAGR